MTGARREELAALTWEDVDFKWRSLTINDKMEGESRARHTLDALFQETVDGPQGKPCASSGNWEMCRTKGPERDRSASKLGLPQSNLGRRTDIEPRGAHVRALSAAGLPHLTLHGLRRSFSTLSEWCETPVGVVAQIQGHKPSAIAEKHYRRRPLDLLRQWHDQIELVDPERGESCTRYELLTGTSD